MQVTPPQTGRVLNAIRSPLVFNALVLIIMGTVTVSVILSGLPDWVKITVLALFVVGLAWMTVWVNIAMRRHPREISYGPNEYVEESKLAHERKMRGI